MATPSSIGSSSLQPKALSDGSLPSSQNVTFSLTRSATGSITVQSSLPNLHMETLMQLYYQYHQVNHPNAPSFLSTLGAAQLHQVVKDPTGLTDNLAGLGLDAHCTFQQWSDKDQQQRQLHATLTEAQATKDILKRSQCWNNILRMVVHENYYQPLA